MLVTSPARREHRRAAVTHGLRGAFVAGALALLAGCGATPAPDGAAATAATDGPDEDAFGAAMVACLEERGWSAKIRSDGGYEVQYPTTQKDQYQADRRECSSGGGYDQPAPPFTQESATQLVADLHAAAECLRGHDYDVPSPPPDAQMIEGLMSPDRDPGWDVYGTVPAGTELSDAQALCAY